MQSETIDRKRKKKIIGGMLWLIILFYGLYLAYDFSFGNVGYCPEQPIVFSHLKHSGDFGIKCLYCHQSAEISSFSQIPTAHHCMICHIALKESSELVVPLSNSYFDEVPIQWTNIYRLPDYVHFNHSRHILASVDCSSCHGEVEKMDSVYQATKLNMKWCLDCHRNPKIFVVPAREISGIYMKYTDSNFFSAISRSMVSPAYGDYFSELPKQPFDWFVYPKKPGRGPEHCSACHY